LDPSYKLLAEEDFVHNSFGRRSICGGFCMLGEGLHQLMMVITIGKAGLEPLEFIPSIHLSNHQGNNSHVANTMEGNLPSPRRDIMEAILQRSTSGIRSPGGIIRR